MTPEEIVKLAEQAYNALDLERMLSLFDPQAVVYFNGQIICQGMDELRAWHESWMKYATQGDHWVRKTFRAANGNTIAGEWEDYALDEDGRYYHGYGGEFWVMRDGLLLEWKAYFTKRPV